MPETATLRWTNFGHYDRGSLVHYLIDDDGETVATTHKAHGASWHHVEPCIFHPAGGRWAGGNRGDGYRSAPTFAAAKRLAVECATASAS